MATKQLYKGMFNFNFQLFIEYAKAYTQDQAKLVMVRRIAKKQGVLPVMVFQFLKEHPESYDILIE